MIHNAENGFKQRWQRMNDESFAGMSIVNLVSDK